MLQTQTDAATAPPIKRGEVDINQDVTLNVGKGTTEVLTPLKFSLDKIGGHVERINAYDLAVNGAVCSIYQSGQTTMTTKQIWNILTGQNAKPGKTALAQVENSLSKQALIRVTIDYTQEAAAHKLQSISGLVIEQYLLPLKKNICNF